MYHFIPDMMGSPYAAVYAGQYTDVEFQVREAKEERESEGLQLQIAVTGSLIANVLLAILQVYAAVTALSLSLFTTMADAIFDPMRYAYSRHVDRLKMASGARQLPVLPDFAQVANMRTVT